MKLENKIAVLTGAGGGIGSVIAQELSYEGATLVLVDIDQIVLDNVSNLVKEKGSNVRQYVADICHQGDVEYIFKELEKEFGRLDILVNNAGIQAPIGRFDSNDLSKWKKNIEVNLFGPLHFSYYAIRLMKKVERGKIINLAGGGSTSSRPNLSAYAVAKTGIVRLTEILADEYKTENIDINAISPGAINSKMLDEILSHSEQAGPEYLEALKRKECGGTDPRIAAKLISFLSSAESDGITGKLISAPWDPWQTDDFQTLLKSDKDFATLRRIDNKTFYKKK